MNIENIYLSIHRLIIFVCINGKFYKTKIDDDDDDENLTVLYPIYVFDCYHHQSETQTQTYT